MRTGSTTVSLEPLLEPPEGITRQLSPTRASARTRIVAYLKGLYDANYAVVVGVVTALLVLLVLALAGSPNITTNPKVTRRNAYIVFCSMASQAVLVGTGVRPEFVMCWFTTQFISLKIITAEAGFGGFADQLVVALGTMFVVAETFHSTGALEYILGKLLPSSRRLWLGQMCLVLTAAAASVLLNNVLVIGFMVPVVQGWAKRQGFPPRSVLLPLSLGAAIGGVCTVVSSPSTLAAVAVSERLLAARKVQAHPTNHLAPMLVGIPLAFVAIIYVAVLSPVVLPPAPPDPDREAGDSVSNRTSADNWQMLRDQLRMARRGDPLISCGENYTVAFSLARPLIGRTADEAALTNPTGEYELLAIINPDEGECAASTWSTRQLVEGDVAIYSCTGLGVTQLRLVNGIDLHSQGVRSLGEGRMYRALIEAVVGPGFTFSGQPFSAEEFQDRFQAALIGIKRAADTPDPATVLATGSMYSPLNARKSRKLSAWSRLGRNHTASAFAAGKLNATPGSMLLMEARVEFVKKQQSAKDFALVSIVQGSRPPRKASTKDRVRIALCITLLVLSLVASCLRLLPFVLLSFGNLLALIAIQICNTAEAIKAVRGDLLLHLATVVGVSQAVLATDVGKWIAGGLLGVTGNIWGILFLLYIIAWLLGFFAEPLSAVAFVMPVAIELSIATKQSHEVFMYAVLYATAFSTMSVPSSHLNVVVWRAGGYRVSDFLLFTGPLQLLLCALTVVFLVAGREVDLWSVLPEKAFAEIFNYPS